MNIFPGSLGSVIDKLVDNVEDLLRRMNLVENDVDYHHKEIELQDIKIENLEKKVSQLELALSKSKKHMYVEVKK